jgi:hypothetical protein
MSYVLAPLAIGLASPTIERLMVGFKSDGADNAPQSLASESRYPT